MTIHARAAGVLAATVAAFAALTASPALGGAPAAALDCNAAFDSLNALTASALARPARRLGCRTPGFLRAGT